jgi:hypothetical protein
MNTQKALGTVLGIAVSFAVVYGYAYVVGKGWKKSQE